MRVSSNAIKAVSLFVAKKDVRYYLQSINFELHWDKTIVTATDGTVFFSMKIDESNEREDNFLIPPDSFPKTNIDYEVHRGDDGKVYVTNGLVKVEVPQNDVRYPDFRRVVPSVAEDNPQHTYFDPERSLLFKKASKLLGGNDYPQIHANGLVDIGLSNCVGVQSPLRVPYSDKDKSKHLFLDGCAPEWITTGIAPKKFVKAEPATIEEAAA